MQEQIAWPEQKETGYIRIRRKDIPQYMTNDLFAAVDLWRKIKDYGWPQGRGYLSEPRALMKLVQLFDTEKANYYAFKKMGSN